MTQRQLASVLFAVLGAFIAISWLPQIVVAVGLLTQPIATTTSAGDQSGSDAYAVSLLIGTLITVLLGIFLVIARDRVAERLFADSRDPLAARETQAVALSVLGCYFVIGGISRLVGRGLRPIDWSAVTQLVLGLALFFGARGVARLWAAARTAGVSSSR